ncbi:nucleotidyltransferase [Streptococcus agalactiae LMG 14747]|uniref:Nucleotidyltransferase n=2 Tax=Streptococcus TaxID=1301 RepID=V6Z069_STRAG|nr:nucleotidyltransferase domain-containing protein [Streptococcus acidominimus]ESV54267.1 nucleotidyltransferase [Streptococcus agalactiae LMG 14747]SNV32052.1 nucleotidyltransferase domain-containing protein [Streptococcus acidominimus]
MVYTIEDIKSMIKPIADKYELSAVYLFGSYARGEANNQSDIDLVYEFKDTVSSPDLFGVYYSLQELFPEGVDALYIEDIKNPDSPLLQSISHQFEEEKQVVYEVA